MCIVSGDMRSKLLKCLLALVLLVCNHDQFCELPLAHTLISSASHAQALVGSSSVIAPQLLMATCNL